MKRFLLPVIAMLIAFSCANNNSANEGKPFEMDGVWEGVLPAADCSGIEYILSLQPQGTYKMTITYIDGEGDGIDMVFYSTGKVVRVHEDKSQFLRLLPPPGNDTVYFKVVDSQVLRLVNKELEEPQNPELYNIVKGK
ncbi:MAG: copper resistance protein NlpE [Bacteroidales bacterium]|nr:copper resistance protein NlpE [Bacteroidales bacterium]MBQ8645861.1 copper resistance protein NlpE N-terminal domain-containing protein [Bacteroidales bacterium]